MFPLLFQLSNLNVQIYMLNGSFSDFEHKPLTRFAAGELGFHSFYAYLTIGRMHTIVAS